MINEDNKYYGSGLDTIIETVIVNKKIPTLINNISDKIIRNHFKHLISSPHEFVGKLGFIQYEENCNPVLLTFTIKNIKISLLHIDDLGEPSGYIQVLFDCEINDFNEEQYSERIIELCIYESEDDTVSIEFYNSSHIIDSIKIESIYENHIFPIKLNNTNK